MINNKFLLFYIENLLFYIKNSEKSGHDIDLFCNEVPNKSVHASLPKYIL